MTTHPLADMGAAFCGLICTECPVYIATVTEDEAMKEKLAADYTTAACKFEKDDMNCNGCHSTEGCCEKMCAQCPIRLCGMKKGIETCAECGGYPCEELKQYVPEESGNRKTLDSMADSFYVRCRRFWNWFEENEPELSKMCEDRESYGQEEITAFVSHGLETVGDLCFHIGGDHELTLAVDGKSYLFYLLPYLTAGLPEKYREKWHIYPCMQPGSLENFSIHMSGQMISMADILLDCSFEKESGMFSIAFYHEAFAAMEENAGYHLFFTALDLSLGEVMSLKYIGNVEQSKEKHPGMMALGGLRKYISETLEKEGIELNEKPGRTYSSYTFNPQENENLRYDVIAGMTACMELIQDYYSGEYRTAEAMEKMGVKAGFLFFAYEQDADRSEILNLRYRMEEEVTAEVFGGRAEIEAESDEEPENIYHGRETGRVLGGAVGTDLVYVDVLIFSETAFYRKAKAWAAGFPYKVWFSEFKQGAEPAEMAVLSGAGRLLPERK